MIIDDFDEPSSHFFPSFPTEKTENVVPLAEFIFKKLKSLNTSFRTSDDIDERLKILEAMLTCSASLSLLTLASLTESQTLIDAAKETFRGI
jgi:hypothetical protein